MPSIIRGPHGLEHLRSALPWPRAQIDRKVSVIDWFLSRRGHLRWVLADQILVSGCNFLITILYARFLGPASFGTYALITVAQQYFVSMSVSLIGNPLITAAPHLRDDEERKQLVQKSFAAQLLVGAALALLAAAGMSACLSVGAADMSAIAVFGLAGSSFALATLEWCRRLCFLHRDGASLFRFDALAYLPIVLATLTLEQRGWFTLDFAVLLWALSSMGACIYAAYRLNLPWRRLRGARAFLFQHWRASRDFATSFQAQWLGSQGIVYFAAPIVGASGIGVYRSTAGLLGFTNAIGTTLDNVLPLHFADAYRNGGNAALGRRVLRFGLVVAALLLLLLVPAAIFASEIVGFLLGGAYVAYSNILRVQGIHVCIQFANRLAIYYERAHLVTHRIAVSAILGAVVSALLVVGATKAMGPVGVAWSTAAGGMVSLLYLSFCIFRDARKA